MRAAQTEFKGKKLMMKREHNGSRNQEMRGILGPLADLHTRNTYDESEKGVIILKLATL